MKKLILGLLAAFLMTTGLVALSSTSALAACPYTGCAETSTTLNGPVKISAGDAPTFSAAVKSVGSNKDPRGTFILTIKGDGDRTEGFYYQAKKGVGDGERLFTGPNLRHGKYTVNVRFVKRANSVSSNSADAAALKVTRN